jgi:CTP synthase (UTP-ammonia lyase)
MWHGAGCAIYAESVSQTFRVALVGDYDPSVPAHQAIPVALELAADHHHVSLQWDWLHTSRIEDARSMLRDYDGIWCVPASPYANTQGALDAIRFAREQGKPFLGTCGGFQHALIEYARNVAGLAAADHAESDPEAALPLISRLSCSLVEKEMELALAEGSLIARSYGATRTNERYRCSFGPNPAYQRELFNGALRATAHDLDGEVRGGELAAHPFFVGTLFQPERRSLRGELPPLVRDFVGSIAG